MDTNDIEVINLNKIKSHFKKFYYLLKEFNEEAPNEKITQLLKDAERLNFKHKLLEKTK